MWTKYIVAALLLASTVLCFSQMNSVYDNNGKYPFLVSVRVNGYFRCVGTVVAPKWVLTAASCVKVPHYIQLSVQYNVKKPTIIGPTVFLVDRVHLYEDWIQWNAIKGGIQAPRTHNIALLELGHEMLVAPVDLPTSDYLEEVELPAFFTSWAVNKNTNELSNKAENVSLMIQNNKDCDTKLNGAFSSSENYCTRRIDSGHEDSCFAFGGPLLYGSIQVGIAVLDNKGQDNCAVPSLYTKVHSYTPWIRSTIQKFSDASPTTNDAPGIGIYRENHWY